MIFTTANSLGSLANAFKTLPYVFSYFSAACKTKDTCMVCIFSIFGMDLLLIF